MTTKKRGRPPKKKTGDDDETDGAMHGELLEEGDTDMEWWVDTVLIKY